MGVQIVLRTIRNIFEDIEFDFGSPDGSALIIEDAATISNALLVIFGCYSAFRVGCLSKGPSTAVSSGSLHFPHISYYLAAWERRRDLHPRHIENTILKSVRIRQVLLATRRAIAKVKILAPYLERDKDATGGVPSSLSGLATRAMFGRMF